MAVDPVVQELMDLVEPPDSGDRARPTSEFGAGRSTGSSPHGGFDMNRGRGVQPHGRVRSPVYGNIKEIDPKLGRIVIEEWDPISKQPTGYDVEILHTQTQTVKPREKVEPTQQIGTQGDVGAPGAFHAHIQVYHGDRTPLNPLRHLFEYHHPGEPIPPLPQFEPQQVPPRVQRGSVPQAGNQGPLAPGGVTSSAHPPAGATPAQLAPGTAIPGAEGSTSIGGPNGPTPLVPPARSRSQAPAGRASSPDSTPPLHFAPEVPQNSGPFALPGPFRSDVFGEPDAARAGTRPSAPTPALDTSGTFAPATSPAAPGSSVPIGDGNGIGDGRSNLAPAVSNIDPASVRRLSSPLLGIVPVDPNQPREAGPSPFAAVPSLPSPSPARSALEALLALEAKGTAEDWTSPLPFRSVDPQTGDAPGGLPNLLMQIGAFDSRNPDQPPTGGLLALLQDHMRNYPDGATKR